MQCNCDATMMQRESILFLVNRFYLKSCKCLSGDWRRMVLVKSFFSLVKDQIASSHLISGKGDNFIRMQLFSQTHIISLKSLKYMFRLQRSICVSLSKEWCCKAGGNLNKGLL